MPLVHRSNAMDPELSITSTKSTDAACEIDSAEIVTVFQPMMGRKAKSIGSVVSTLTSLVKGSPGVGG